MDFSKMTSRQRKRIKEGTAFEPRNYRDYTRGELFAAWFYIGKKAREAIGYGGSIGADRFEEKWLGDLDSHDEELARAARYAIVLGLRDEGFNVDHTIKCATRYFGEPLR